MAKTIMIQGTMSSVGKSFITTGLCRVFYQDGFRVAPFKSQNMSSNFYMTNEGLKMSKAQAIQAEAANIAPNVLMNPIMLMPTSDVGSEVIVNGKTHGCMSATEYFQYKKMLISDIMHAFETLSKQYDVIVIEGAGSPVEININQHDIVNMGLAKMTDSPVLLVGDIDCGGVFAQMIGTLVLLNHDEKNRIKGLVVNKFRGDIEILRPGLSILEEKSKKSVMGVLPYLKVNIEEEDSLVRGQDKSVAENILMKNLSYREEQYDKLADSIRENLDMKGIYKIIGCYKSHKS